MRRCELDVFATEPLAVGSPLRQAANCLITPHVAWCSDAAVGAGARQMIIRFR